MNRRRFLQVTGLALSALPLMQFGCSSTDGKGGSTQTYNAGTEPFYWDIEGSKYLIKPGAHSIAKISENRNPEWEIGGVAGAEEGAFNLPVRMTADHQENLYVVDSGNHRIVVLDNSGNFQFHIGGYGDGDGDLNSPNDLALDQAGNLYLCDALNHRIQIFDAMGKPVFRFGELGFEGNALNLPCSIAVAKDKSLHVVDAGNARVQIYDTKGSYLGSYGSPGAAQGQFIKPCAIETDEIGFSYVADSVQGTVQVFDADGKYESTITVEFPEGSLAVPMDLTWDPFGGLYIRAHPRRLV
jgi:DNA-binding beta-propeller fold protein YncE